MSAAVALTAKKSRGVPVGVSFFFIIGGEGGIRTPDTGFASVTA